MSSSETDKTKKLKDFADSRTKETGIDFDLDDAIEDKYREEQSEDARTTKKIMFSLFTLGFGALYLWATTKVINQGQLCARRLRNGYWQVLPPGRHSNLPGEDYGDVQSITQPVVVLGPPSGAATRIVTIKDGENGVSYKNGKLVILPPGRHLLDPLHVFVQAVTMDNDEVDLGAKKIITIKNGSVGIAYDKGVLRVLKEGRHELNLPDERFHSRVSLRQEVVELPQLDIKTTDNIQVNVHAVLNYRIVDPIKAVTNVDNLKKSLEELAEVTLSSILRRLSFRDISPIPDEITPEIEAKRDKGKGKAKHFASAIQERMHDDFHEDFSEIVRDWGVEIIGGVQIKTIEPRDAALRQAIAGMAIDTAKADSHRRQAEFERQVRNTKALAEKEANILHAEGQNEGKLVTARGDKEAYLIKIEAERDGTILKAEADRQSQVIRAQGEAEALRVVSKAQREMTENEGKAAEALTSPIAQQLALLTKQAEVLKQCKTPVYVPASTLGQVNVWSKNEGTMAHFTNMSPELGTKSGSGSGGGGGDMNALLTSVLVENALKT